MLIGFENGVYDLENHIFREGQPDDLISLSTGKNYTEEIPDNISTEIDQFLSEIFPNSDDKHYILKLMASFLKGIPDEKLYILTGSSSNGKSTLLELLELSLGDYACKLSSNILHKRYNAYHPELARTNNMRIVSIQEPDEETEINLGTIKELTGTNITCHQLYSNGNSFNFRPQFKLLMMCSNLSNLKIQTGDEGTRNGCIIIKFVSRFINNPVEINEYKRDDNMSAKIGIWSNYFINILLRYSNEELTPSKNIIKATEEFLNFKL